MTTSPSQTSVHDGKDHETVDTPEASSSSLAAPAMLRPRDANGGPLVTKDNRVLVYRSFIDDDRDMADIMRLCDQELSEPYNSYTFRYFVQDWPHLTFMVYTPDDLDSAIGTIVCKQETHRGKTNRGYIAMLSVDRAWRRKGIASTLVQHAMREMIAQGASEIALETEYDNTGSLSLYGRLGFIREKRLHRFYSNGKDAFRLILPLPPASTPPGDTGRGLAHIAEEPNAFDDLYT